VVQRRVTAAITRRFLGIKLREGSSHHVVEVPPGRHEISVSVRWEHEERSGKIAGDFAAGATPKLTAKIGRIGPRLAIEWDQSPLPPGHRSNPAALFRVGHDQHEA